jgi:OmpA-OmpF porin, OOP family
MGQQVIVITSERHEVLNYICQLSHRMMRVFILLLSVFFTLVTNGQAPPEDVFGAVNSPLDERNPVIAPGGKRIYFTIGNHPQNVGGKKDPGDIWYSDWMGTTWSAPVHGGKAINDYAYNAVADLTEDGNSLILLSHYDQATGRAKTQGISIAKREVSGWSNPKNINIPYFQNKSDFVCGELSADETVFIYAAETYGSVGVEDLYVSILTNGKWSEPKNLGQVINTPFQEVTPSLSRDGKTLYFSTNGRKGNGSFDVFSSTRLDESWTAWSEPVNMGTSVNTDGRELYFRDYEELGYSLVTSTKNSDGYGDIKMARFREPEEIAKDPLIVKQVHQDSTITAYTGPVLIQPTQKVTPDVLNVYGKVVNVKTGETIPAKIVFTSVDSSFVLDAAADGFRASLPPLQRYHVKIESQGFVSAMNTIDGRAIASSDLEMTFHLQPVELGTTVNLKSVLFVQTKTELLPESYDELDLVVSFLKANPNIRIELSGHTDNRGVSGDNVRLSQERVNTVKRYLVSKGIDGKRITGKGYGGTKPIASNDTEENRQMNRRVEFTIKKF